MALGALVLCAGTSRALADAVWIKPTGGNWNSSSSWQGGQFPTPSQVVYFDERAGGTGLTFTANMNGSAFNSQCKALFVQSNTVTLDFGPGSEHLMLQGNFPSSASLVVGQKNISGTDYAGTLKIVNTGAFDSDRLNGSDAVIGTGPGPAASFIVRGGGGAGVVSVENDGDLNGGTVTVGTSAAGTGSLTVTDSGSTADFGQINLGSGGTGTVSVASGGGLTTSSLVVGLSAAGSGLLTVGGSGSTATATTTTIGNGGTGTVTVNSAGSFSSTTLNIGQNAGGSGQFNITGSGATANTTGTATVGNGGTGTVAVSSGGHFTGANLVVGANAVGSGGITVSGSGSEVNFTSITTVGNGGTGTITASGGGLLSGATLRIGQSAVGSGQVTISGSGTTGTFTGTATVGNGGTGILTVDQGADLTCNNLVVGGNAAGSGSLTIDGAGSSYIGTINIGSVGPGSVLVSNGALLQGSTSIGSANASITSTLTIDGAGSVWAPSGVSNVGYGSNAQIVLSNGGSCNAGGGVFYCGYSTLPTSHALIEVGAGCTFSTSATVILSNVAATAPETARLTLGGGTFTTTQGMTGFQPSAVTGHGTLNFLNASFAGRIVTAGPTPTTYGTLVFNPASPSTPTYFTGSIEVRARGDDAGPHDEVVIDGPASISGSLLVSSAGSPPGGGNTLALPLVTANSFVANNSRFQAAVLPRLNDGRFYRVTYPETGGSVTLNVQSLFNSPDFNGGSGNTSVNATVTAADRGDLSGDGLDDLAVTTSDGFVFILIGNGDGTFNQTIQLPVGNNPRGVAIADLDPANPNGNGLDLVVSNSDDDTLTVYSRNNLATWFVAATVATGDQPMGLCALDIDGDGDVDIADANFGSDSVSLLRGQSNTAISLASQSTFPTGDGPTDVDPWDSDNTKGGSQSLVTSNRSGNNMSFLENNGGGGFNAPLNFSTGAGPFQVLSGDLNLDGNSDVATLNDDGTLTIFISDGAGSFLDGAPVPVGDSPLSMARADLDLDGDLDIAVVADNDSALAVVKVFRNDTDPFDNNLTLAAPSEVSTPTPQIVLTGMVDPDSRPDLITVGSGPRTLTTVTTVANSSLCPSDYDQNGFVNGDDFDAFVVEFYYGTILADFDHNGFVNGDDFDGFTAAFEAGC